MKKTTAPTTQGIAGANAAYCQRLAQLAQESQQRWMEPVSYTHLTLPTILLV